MSGAIAKYDFILGGVLRVVYYRSLHLVSVPFHPQDVLAYAEEHAAGGAFHGRVKPVRSGPLFSAWLWRDVQVGEGLFMDVFFFGFNRGAQTVLVRKGFWKLNFSAREREPLT